MADTPAAPAKSKKLIIILVAVVLLVVAAGVAFVLLKRGSSADEEDAAPARPAASAPVPKTPPTYLPMDNMVVNLADPGGDRFAQVGITLELADGKTADAVKAYMPAIRSEVLKQISRRTADELLTPEGKDKLALDIRREASRPLGFTVPKPRKRKARPDPEDEDDEEDVAPAPRADNNPVLAVHFSSFIIQ